MTRKDLGERRALAQCIDEVGMLQPIVVRAPAAPRSGTVKQ
jgi:hypothetical protein